MNGIITLKSVFSHLKIPGEQQFRTAHVQLAKWQHMLAAESDTKSTVNKSDMSTSNEGTHASKPEKDWDKIIEEALRSNTHL